MKLRSYLVSEAVIEGNHRYLLKRVWDNEKPVVTFIMLNPSTADESEDDNTIRSCRRLCENWGYGGFEVVNLFSFRTKDISVLNFEDEVIGKKNDNYILDSIKRTKSVVLAWGNTVREKKIKKFLEREKQIVELITGNELFAAELTKLGCPKHPLYVSSQCKLTRIQWNGIKFVEK